MSDKSNREIVESFFGKDFGWTDFVLPEVAGWWRNKT
jgi:hypothetical protein